MKPIDSAVDLDVKEAMSNSELGKAAEQQVSTFFANLGYRVIRFGMEHLLSDEAREVWYAIQKLRGFPDGGVTDYLSTLPDFVVWMPAITVPQAPRHDPTMFLVEVKYSSRVRLNSPARCSSQHPTMTGTQISRACAHPPSVHYDGGIRSGGYASWCMACKYPLIYDSLRIEAEPNVAICLVTGCAQVHDGSVFRCHDGKIFINRLRGAGWAWAGDDDILKANQLHNEAGMSLSEAVKAVERWSSSLTVQTSD